jgi:hypothetical protein
VILGDRITVKQETGGTIGPTRNDYDLGATAEWYLTVRCANLKCERLIAFKNSVDPGDRPNLCIAITGKPSVVCPHASRDAFLSQSNRAASGDSNAMKLHTRNSLWQGQHLAWAISHWCAALVGPEVLWRSSPHVSSPKDGTGTLSGQPSGLRMARWHSQQDTSSDRTPFARIVRRVIDLIGFLDRIAPPSIASIMCLFDKVSASERRERQS